ncbi:NADP-dependent oxidoreductase domain-containing protein [Coniochaeta sp. 2T2.1]|nr:NADP-dependent oxidoreductase domain-containing protein [Coniochaeta sp. 2T2.1]
MDAPRIAFSGHPKGQSPSSRHPPGHDYPAETVYGNAGVADDGFRVDVKNHIAHLDARGSMSAENVRGSVEGSLERLGVKKAWTFWCYSPDESTPLEEQVGVADGWYRRGRFEKFGLSNFFPAQVRAWLAICEEKYYVKPTVYQGIYNLIIREFEQELIPLLREHGIAFHAWQALAAGFLSGKATTGRGVEGTRYDSAHPFGPFVRKKYDRLQYHNAVKRLLDAVEPHGIAPTEAALRWLCYHSALGEGDGIILGASKLEQVRQNVEAVARGPLPDGVIGVIEEVGKTLSEVGGNTTDVM